MKVNFKLYTLRNIQKDLQNIYKVELDPMRGYRIEELQVTLHKVDQMVSDMIKKEIELSEFDI
tara:strand:+ start:206 stop:394 length:189 start_codon:yes stop_codon:yes gene_type:complete